MQATHAGLTPTATSTRGVSKDRLTYRAEIDGLRAIAILPVVFFHAGIPGFSGGFVGVDVFFVISGYLMAGLIGTGIDRGDFSLVRFYEGRVRRIFPALFAMIAVSTMVAWLVFMPVELEYFAGSVKATALFISNIRFESESGYFDIGSQLKPLLHTWSLSVEEQFYVVFPLVMLATARILPGLRLPVLFALLAASFVASILTVEHAPAAAFYGAQFRAWELLLGALLALAGIPHCSTRLGRELFTAFGIVAIGLAVFTFDDQTPFPGASALLPCLGAAAIILAGPSDGVAGRFLRTPPLVFIGLISYSLYLWHWPVIVFTRYFDGHEPSLWRGSLIVAVSLILSGLSWRFIEQPFRLPSSKVSRFQVFAAAVVVLVAGVWIAGYVVAQRGLPGRLAPSVRAIYAATYDVSRFSKPDCLLEPSAVVSDTGEFVARAPCALGRTGSADPSVVVWGDSHAAAIAPAVDVAAKGAGIQGLLAAHASCPPLPGLATTSDDEKSRRCGAFNAAVRRFIAARHIPLVILVAYWPKYMHGAELPNQGVYFDASIRPPLEDRSAPIAKALDDLLRDLTSNGTKTVLVMDVPEMGHYVPEALARAAETGSSTDIAPPWAYTSLRQALSRTVISTAALKFGAPIVDPLPAFCSKDHCDAARGGVPLYRDSDHITAATAEGLSFLFTPLFQARPAAVR